MLNKIISNTYTQASLIFGALGGLLSDALNMGYTTVTTLAFIGVCYGWYDENRKKKIYSKPNIPIPLVFNISNPADSKSTLSSLFNILNKDYPEHQENLKKYFNIIEDDLLFKYDGDIFDEERFVDFLKVTKHDIKKLDAKTPQNINFHIIYIGPIANAILIGTMLGTEGITLYQYNKSSDSYNISLNIDSREYKEHINEFKIIKKETKGDIKNNSDVTIAIDLASHKIALAKLKEPIIHLQSNIGATIHNPKDFIRANQEIYAVINDLQQSVSHIKLAYSIPTTIGILLGMSIQNYWDIELTQFSDGEYKTITHHLNKIKYYF
jgi:hypothetical protein